MKSRRMLFFLCLLLPIMSLPVVAQRIAVKSNLLSPVGGTLNGGIEYALKDRATLELYGSVRPWSRAERYVNRYWLLQTEYRYWFCQKFNGHFGGIYLNGAQFNVGGKRLPFGLFPDLKEHRYAGWLIGIGGSYGYQFMLDRHWNIELSLSIGYEYVDYRKYRCPLECAGLQKKDVHHYLGPTKAALSLIYLF